MAGLQRTAKSKIDSKLGRRFNSRGIRFAVGDDSAGQARATILAGGGHMEESEKPILMIGAAFLAFAVVVLTAWVTINLALSVPKDRSGEVAAWVQAIGSIGAIAGAVYVMRKQSEAATKLASDMEQLAIGRRIAAIEAIVENAYAVSTHFEVHTRGVGDLHEYFSSVIEPNEVAAAVSALNAIPVHTLESYKMVRAILEMAVKLNALAPYTEIHGQAADVHYVFEGDDCDRVKYLCKKIRTARDNVREAIIELGLSLNASTESVEQQ
jgi:hypothetical protein